MKAREFITEATWQDQVKAAMKADKQIESPEKVAQFFEFVEQNCATFLSEIGGIQNINKFSLYHGTKLRLAPARLLTVRKNRTPIDTPEDTQELIDDWFEKRTGIRFRESSVFATGNPANAEAYGSLSVMFPVGKFNYAWSPVYDDLTSSLEIFMTKNGTAYLEDEYDTYSDIIYTDSAGMEFNKHDVTNPKLINLFMVQGMFKVNKNLRDAIISNNEITLDCNQAIIVDYNWLERAIG